MYDILRQRFWALLHTAVKSGQGPKLISLADNEARILFEEKRLLVILLDEQPQEKAALLNWVKVLFEENVAREIDVVVLAPTAEVDKTLEAADFEVPWTMRLSIVTLHENGIYHEITERQSDKYALSLIDQSLKVDRSESAISQMKVDVKNFVETERKSDGEILRFQRNLRVQGSSATLILLGIIAFFFFLQTWFGGTDYTPALVRMGANSEILVRQGEIWRLITSIFLHGSLIHVLANGYVLFALGNFFNRLLGDARFITLFLVSGICGSLSSVWIGGAPLSVGASGALWGLFGLSGALIMRPSHFLPDRIRQSMRRVTLINLVINLGISFLPMVDLWAHLGGGVAGFALGLIYVFQGEHPRHRRTNIITAVFMTVLAVACVGINFYEERPWLLTQPIQLRERKIGDGSMTIEIPSILTAVTINNSNTTFGDHLFDPLIVTINSVNPNSVPVSAEEQGELLKSAMRSSLFQMGASSSEIRVRTIEGYQTVSATVGTAEGGKMWIWFQLRGTLMISVSIQAPPHTPPPLTQNLERIVASIKTKNP